MPRNDIAQWVSRNFQHQQNGASAFTSTLDVLPTSIASIRCNFVLSRPDLRPQRIRECHWNQSVTLVLPPFYRFYDFFLMGGSYLNEYLCVGPQKGHDEGSSSCPFSIRIEKLLRTLEKSVPPFHECVLRIIAQDAIFSKNN